MSNLSPFPERLQKALKPAPGGVVGVVENLLGLCREQELQLDWHANECRVRPLGAEPHESIAVPLQKSVFRAILARLAALCNERLPNSVSPYGGEGEFSVGANPPTVFRVTFTNSRGEQRLEVRRMAADKDGAKKFTVLLRGNRVVTVRGHALKFIDSGSYGVLSRAGDAEVLVALFPVKHVIGIFSGDMQVPRESA